MKRTPERNAWLKQQRDQRKLWAERTRDGLCFNCGRSDWVDCIDNAGGHYKGCAHCVIVLDDLRPGSPDQ